MVRNEKVGEGDKDGGGGGEIRGVGWGRMSGG